MSMVSPARRPVAPVRRHLSPVAQPARRDSKSTTSSARQTRQRPRTFFAIVTAAVLFGIMIVQMLLSVALESGAYEIAHLQSANKEASRSYSQMSQDLDRLSSPQHLALNAEALGMLSNNTPAYLRLSDGAVLGAPTSGDGFTNLVAPDGGSLVPNALLADVPLVTTPPASEPAPQDSTPGAPPAAIASGPVPLTNGLPGLATR